MTSYIQYMSLYPAHVDTHTNHTHNVIPLKLKERYLFLCVDLDAVFVLLRDHETRGVG